MIPFSACGVLNFWLTGNEQNFKQYIIIIAVVVSLLFIS